MRTKTSDLVSIAIPAFKASFLEDAIKSVVSQTYSNIEIIIVDDHSPEPIAEIVNKFKDSRIRFKRNEQNLGKNDPAKNWNECLKLATGKYFSLLCDDDRYEPTFIEKMLSLREQNPSVNVFRSRVSVINFQNSLIDLYPDSPAYETYDDYMWQKFSGLRRQTISEFFYETQHIKNLGGFANLPMAWGADVLSILKFAKENGIISTSECLVQFRMSNKNISSNSNKNLKLKFDALNKFHREICQIANELPDCIQKKLVQRNVSEVYRKDFAYLFSLASVKDYLWISRKTKLSLPIIGKCFEEKIRFIIAKHFSHSPKQ